MNTITRMFPVCCLALAACGSGGDGSDTQAPAAPDFKLTAANAEMSAAKTWQAANESASMSDIASSSGILSLKPGASKATPGFIPTASLANILHKVPFGPETLPCQVSGTITVSGELEDPMTFSTGDVISTEADSCDDGLGETTDGLLEISIDSFSGDLLSGAYEIAMTLEFTSFQVTTADEVLASNGDISVSLNALSAPMITAGVSGNSLVMDSNTESSSLVGFSHVRTLDAGLQPAPYTLAVSGTLDNTNLPGSVAYSTPVTFEGSGAAYPGSGELLLRGEDSSARLVAIDEVSVRIDIDSDGDGTVDESIQTTWQAIADAGG